MSSPEREASLFMDMIIHLEDELIKQGVAEEKASSSARETCEQLRKTFGGELIYVSKGRDVNSTLKHHEVFKGFNGNNHRQLAKQFDITVPHVYRIIKKILKEETDKRQPQLF